MNKFNGLFCAYLRKSRADLEEEARGQGETLARHARILEDLAARLGVHVSETYRELVSGDTIAERPEVRRLLADINAGKWDGVLVVDVDRLGRGDSIDQGVIMQSFVYSNTLIVTPEKTYDPQDDSDAEFFEIKLFFSRREYSMIKKRLQRGRLSSAADGCYMGSRPVFGYERYKLPGRKGWSLRIVPQQADAVRAIFDWYAYGMDGKAVGCTVIARRINDMGFRTVMGHEFTRTAIAQILRNPAYVGKVQWNQRITAYRIEDGVRTKKRVKNPDALLIDGLHEPIVSMETWTRVQQLFAEHAKRPVNFGEKIVNPLSGLVVCGVCGHHMSRKNALNRKGAFLACMRQGCPTHDTYIHVVEESVLEVLGVWVAEFEAEEVAAPSAGVAESVARETARREQEAVRGRLQGQLERLYDLLEQGVYSADLYRERHAEITQRIAEADARLAALSDDPRPDERAVFIPRVRTVLSAYGSTEDPEERNALLRSVIDHITYNKSRRCYRNDEPGKYLEIQVFPRVSSGVQK